MPKDLPPGLEYSMIPGDRPFDVEASRLTRWKTYNADSKALEHGTGLALRKAMIKTETGLMRALNADPDNTVGRCWGGLKVRTTDGRKTSVLPKLISNLEESGKIIRIDDRSSKIGEEWIAAKWIRK